MARCASSARLLTAVSATIALAVAVAPGVSAASAEHKPTATAASTCKPPRYPGSGYFTSLRGSHVSCTTGRKVALAHYHCRIKHGKAGHCGAVVGYHCSERRNAIPTEIDSRVTCHTGSRKIVFSYQQNL